MLFSIASAIALDIKKRREKKLHSGKPILNSRLLKGVLQRFNGIFSLQQELKNVRSITWKNATRELTIRLDLV
jgi:hypothetical protein